MNAVNNFSPRALKVLTLARQEVDRLKHNYVGTEHLLLGILTLGQGTAVNVLQGLGLDPEAVRTRIETIVLPGAEKFVGNIPYTPRVKKVLALAGKEARALRHTYVGTEHLLLGIIRENDGAAARVLKEFNVEMECTRIEILKVLDPNFVSTQISPVHGCERPPEVTARLTPRAQQVIALARKEADRLYHSYIGAEHLLLGLAGLQGVASNVLQKLDLDLEKIRAEVEKQVERGTTPPGSPESLAEIGRLKDEIIDFQNRKEAAIRGQDFVLASAMRDSEVILREKLKQIAGDNPMARVPYTQQIKKILALAGYEARDQNHSYIGTEHLLLGLFREGDNPATRVLRALDVDLEKTKAAVLSELNPTREAPKSNVVLSEKMNATLQELDTRVDALKLDLRLQKLEQETKLNREELSRKLDAITNLLESLKAGINQLRDNPDKNKPAS